MQQVLKTDHGLPDKSLCSLIEILPYLPIKRSTVWRWVSMNKFPTPVRIGRLTRWRTEDVKNWLQQYTGGGNDGS